MADDLTCRGLHTHAEQDGCERLRWIPDTNRSDRVRVISYTCGLCRVVSWELCSAGGLMFIRRTDRSRGGNRVHETERLPAPRIEPIWARLIAGEAR